MVERRKRIPIASVAYVKKLTEAGIADFGTAGDLARAIGVHHNSVRAWLHGRWAPNASSFVWLQNRYGKIR